MAYLSLELDGNAVEQARGIVSDLMWEESDLREAKTLGSLAMALPVYHIQPSTVRVHLNESEQVLLVGILSERIRMFGQYLIEYGAREIATNVDVFPDEIDALLEETDLFVGIIADMRAALRDETTENVTPEN